MKLWLLQPSHPSAKYSTVGPWEPWYDKSFGFIVRAETDHEARELASAQAGDEKADAWIDASMSTCVELTPDGPAEVVMQDYHAT